MPEEHIKRPVVDKQCDYIYINSNISTKVKWALTGMGALGTHSDQLM